MQTKVLKDAGLGALVALALYASGFLVIFTPLPFIYLSLSRGRGAGFAAAFISLAMAALVYSLFLTGQGESVVKGVQAAMPATVLSAFLPEPVVRLAGVGYFAFFIVVGLSIAEGAVRKWSLTKLGGVALASGLFVILIFAGGALFYNSGGFLAGIKSYLIEALSQIASVNQGASSSIDATFLANNAEGIARFMLGISPSLVFVLALVAVVVNLLIGRRFIRAHHAFAHVHNVARFRLPDYVIWAVIIGGGAFFAERYAFGSLWFKMASINLLVALGALYFFQGFAVVVYYLQGIRIPLVRTLAYVMLILFFQTIGMVIVGVGIADVWVDFRRRKKTLNSKH